MISDKSRLLKYSSIVTYASLLLLFSEHASAYYYDTCYGRKIRWNSRNTTMYISTTSFPEGWSYTNRIEDAMQSWNDVQGSEFVFYVDRDTDGHHSLGNNMNEVYWVYSPDEDFIAATVPRTQCWRIFNWYTYGIKEMDIEFNLAINTFIDYTPSDHKYILQGDDNPAVIEGVALHELGHALGLSPGNDFHENSVIATMNSHYPFGATVGNNRKWTPLPDDRNGVRYLYPDNTKRTDIAASVYKQSNLAGDVELADGFPLYVFKGEEEVLEYTVMNLGTENISEYDICFYLSSDKVIDPVEDYWFYLGATFNASISPGSAVTYSRTVTIPTYISSGIYYVGFVVDCQNEWAESSEENNSMALPDPFMVW